jgi:hypothetical protein
LNLAIGSCGKAGGTIVGLRKILSVRSVDDDLRDSKRRCAGVDQSRGLRRAAGVDDLLTETEAGRSKARDAAFLTTLRALVDQWIDSGINEDGIET